MSNISIKDVMRVLTNALKKANKDGIYELEESYSIMVCLNTLNEYIKKMEERKTLLEQSGVIISATDPTDQSLETIEEKL
jgi:hypothetical protein